MVLPSSRACSSADLAFSRNSNPPQLSHRRDSGAKFADVIVWLVASEVVAHTAHQALIDDDVADEIAKAGDDRTGAVGKLQCDRRGTHRRIHPHNRLITVRHDLGHGRKVREYILDGRPHDHKSGANPDLLVCRRGEDCVTRSIEAEFRSEPLGIRNAGGRVLRLERTELRAEVGQGGACGLRLGRLGFTGGSDSRDCRQPADILVVAGNHIRLRPLAKLERDGFRALGHLAAEIVLELSVGDDLQVAEGNDHVSIGMHEGVEKDRRVKGSGTRLHFPRSAPRRLIARSSRQRTCRL